MRPCGSRTMRRLSMAPSSRLVVREVSCAHTGFSVLGGRSIPRSRRFLRAGHRPNAGSSREIQEDPRQCRTVQRNAANNSEIQGYPSRSNGMQESPGRKRLCQEHAGSHSIQKRNSGRCRLHSCGKVEFCLPTKLQALRAPSSTFAALRLLYALNAFGLFAAESRGLDDFEPGHRGRALRGLASGGYSYAGYILTATHFAS